MVELLVVMSIIATLAALLFPVVAQAKGESKKTACASNLKQIFLATSLYRSQNDGDGVYGTTQEMGLPPAFQADALPILNSLRCPEGNRVVDRTLGSGYWILYTDPASDLLRPTWEEYAQTYGDQAVLYIDPFHNAPQYSLMWGKHLTRFFQAVNVGGALVKRRAKGDWQQRFWWRP